MSEYPNHVPTVPNCSPRSAIVSLTPVALARKLLVLGLLGLGISTAIVQPAAAGTVLDRVLKTGVLNAGARQAAVPFGYLEADGTWSGYSLDLLNLIRDRLERRIDRPIQLQLELVTVADRFKRVRSGELAIVCGATSITAPRLEFTNFSVPFFVTGTQFLLLTENIDSFDFQGTLTGVSIAYIPGTTTDRTIRQVYPGANWHPVSNRPEAMELLIRHDIRAIASDGILLTGETRRPEHGEFDFVLAPSQPMTTEMYGCILPQDDPAWKTLVDSAIASEANRQLQSDWFNPDTGRYPYPWHIWQAD
ncbi:ABC-type amino acid transport/signal transduction system, periplasmic component [Rubidibacter lacunae KORDI 51-2]|uniref:ABC-type amino acid transport/signal transduction system, periplasmic component n=1 Tax=Rubidibacter lacunae KORDI 51-2 TaxID=582515 RepID=U5DBE6_9CHRO|nr:amino acid ABC transporter substrate-binding protein [Rubidibacter lacunae]ERN41868.1 ABC-type amino acid transport/signal transduction system, periplasmic component [Rubidibacter lacunae KORDI 51-2]